MGAKRQRSHARPWGSSAIGQASPACVDPYLRLAAGVLAQASKEAMRGDLGAAIWLMGNQAALYSNTLQVDYNAITRKAREWATNPTGTIVIGVCAE